MITIILYYILFSVSVNILAYIACLRAKTDIELWGKEVE